MSAPLVIQPYSSRFETIRTQLSREAFENYGIEIFSTEKIPFADRTGPGFAKNLVKLLTVRLKKLKRSGRSFPDGIHIYELGAGTGILAKRILYLLKNNHPEIYRQLVLHLSDISKKTVAQLKALDSFKEYRDHISFEVIDAVKPAFTHKPLLVYFTNLIDSIPHQRHIFIKDGQIFEVQIQTSLKKDAQIIDATSYPPKILEQKEISDVISSPSPTGRLILAPQILTVLEEEAKPLPINVVVNISKKELEDLDGLKSFLNRDRPLPFNYSYPVRTMIREIIQGLEEGGFLLFSDFGVTSQKYAQSLYIEFVSVIAFSVDFPSLAQIAETAGKTCYLTDNPPGFPQEMLIDTLPGDKQIRDLFKRESIGGTQTQARDFMENVKVILSGNEGEKSRKSEKIDRLYQSLPAGTKIDYLLLNELALLLTKASFHQEASSYADLIPANYDHAVGIIYYLVKGKFEQERGDLKEAEKFFKEAIAVEGGRGFLAYVYLGELYWQQERYREYIEVVKKYLKYTRQWGHLKGMVSIAAAQERLFGAEAARQTLRRVVAIGRNLKTISDSEKESLRQAEQWLKK